MLVVPVLCILLASPLPEDAGTLSLTWPVRSGESVIDRHHPLGCAMRGTGHCRQVSCQEQEPQAWAAVPPTPHRGQQHKAFGSSDPAEAPDILSSSWLSSRRPERNVPVLSDSPKVKEMAKLLAPWDLHLDLLLPDHPGKSRCLREHRPFPPVSGSQCWD